MSAELGVRLPVPPFTLASASEKVQLAENGWNSKDPEKVASINDRPIKASEHEFKA